MYFPKLGATKAFHVGLSDPTFLPRVSTLQLPGLTTINGPLIVGGTEVDGIMGPIFPRTSTVNIIPSINAPGTALKISALGDGTVPFPGIGLQCSAVNHNLLATTLIEITSPLTRIIGRLRLTDVGDVAAVINSKKNFDIPHPTKENHRLRYVCTETPEAGVYIRGKSKSDVIELPEYWRDLVHEDSITVNLTPVGSFQHLYVQSIKDNKVVVGGGLPCNGEIVYNYHYTIFAERKDCERNIPEYEGNSPNDYPGDNSQSSIVGWNYDRRIL